MKSTKIIPKRAANEVNVPIRPTSQIVKSFWLLNSYEWRQIGRKEK